MNDLEQIKRHLGKSIPIKITNEDGVEDTFFFKPLNIEQQTMMIGLSKAFQGKTKKELEQIDPESFKEMAELIKNVVEHSLKLEEPMLEDFVVANFNTLMDKVFDLMPGIQDSKGLDKIKKKIKENADEQK